MAITATDIKFFLSGTGGTGDTSLGGAIHATEVSATVNQFFDVVSGAESSAGDTEYRCLYVKNTHGSLTLYSAKVWISSNTPSTDTEITIGLGTAAVSATEQTVADESTAPSGVSFSTAASEGAALSIGDLVAGAYKAVWVKRVVSASAAAYTNDTFTITVRGDSAA
jgi:hypothetical protein